MLLTDAQLHQLRHYKYAAEDRSLTYRFFLSPLYTRAVNWLPPWLAPNAVTLLGFSAPLAAHILVLAYTRTDSLCPPWLHVLCALCLLWYMVLDNLDGKQARRTQSSSPLGQLFDHGCDAINVTVSGILMLPCVVAITSATMTMSSSLSMLSDTVVPVSLLPVPPPPPPPVLHPALSFAVISFAGLVPFYTATTEEFHTGSLILPTINGPNEGLLFLACVHVACALRDIVVAVFHNYNHEWNVLPRQILSLLFTLSSSQPCCSPHHLMVIASLLFLCYCSGGNVSRTKAFYSTVDHKQQVVNKKSRSFSHALAFTFLPILLVPAVQLSTAWLAPMQTTRCFTALLWQAGLLLFDAVTRIMLATLTHAPFPSTTFHVPSVLVVPFLLSYTAVAVHAVPSPWWWRFLGIPFSSLTTASLSVVYACVGCSMLYCAWNTYGIISQITRFLNIYCFSLRRRRPGISDRPKTKQNSAKQE